MKHLSVMEGLNAPQPEVALVWASKPYTPFLIALMSDIYWTEKPSELSASREGRWEGVN